MLMSARMGRARRAYQVVRDAAAGLEGEFGRAEVEMAVDLQGIAIHDFPAEFRGNLQCQVAFTRTGRTEDGNQRKLRRV